VIYVDDMRLLATVGRIRGKWSHLMSDAVDLEELHEFAQSIGLRRGWFQNHPVLPHYDVTDSKRTEAVAKGARSVEYPTGTAEVIERRRLALASAVGEAK
jgi:hypothetical protein